MSLANPAALWWLLLAVPVIALHVLRSRRTRLEVSSVQEWVSLARPVAASRPWQRLRWSLPLLLQLLAVALLAVALAQPQWDTGRRSADHVVVIMDTSASMAALDGEPDRMAVAREEARDVLGSLGDEARASLITTGGAARIVTASDSPGSVESRLEGVESGEGSFDVAGTASLALSLDRPDEVVDYVLVSDGGIDGAAVRALPAGTEFRPVGRGNANVGVSDVVVTPRGTASVVAATVRNAGDDPTDVVVRFDVDGLTAADEAVRVEAGEQLEVGAEVPRGERYEAILDVDDLSVVDNHAYAVGGSSATLDVVVVGRADPFLDAALGVQDGVTFTRMATLEEAGDLSEVDLVIFDGVPIADAPPLPWMAISPEGGAPGIATSGTVDGPVPTLVRTDTDLLEDIDLREVVFGSVQGIDAPAATTLIGSEQTPLLVQGRDGSVPFVYLAASLEETNLGLLAQFPVLMERIVRELAGAELTGGQVLVGDHPPIDRSEAITVVSPSGRSGLVPPGGAAPELDLAGFWELGVQGGRSTLVAVNVPPSEIDVRPSSELAIAGAVDSDPEDLARVAVDLTAWIVLAALLVLVGEWLVSRRRRGVARRQWRAAVAVRLVAGCALVAVLITPEFSLPNDSVASVFVLDVSDSLATSSQEASDVVAEAIAEMPGGSVAGVVVVGATARIDRVMGDEIRFAAPNAVVDTSATDLAAGLRIASAIAPDSHARRVVLVSDGRANTGDLDDEIARLRTDGIPVDVVPIDTSTGADLLVSGVSVPPTAREGDAVEVGVAVKATVAQTASVVLERDGEEVDRRVVELPAGDSTVSFTQPSGAPGTVRWTARVAGPSNGILANDQGFGSTRIGDRTSVALVEGATGNGEPLARALGSSGSTVRTVGPDDLNSLAAVAGDDVIVLVDVPAAAVDGDRFEVLRSAVEDLGKGLLVLGGTSSFGAGDYLGSSLEELLPLSSEVDDPERRSPVAQVFAVDTSGSMGACHCAEGAEGQNRLSNGVRKTDIARDAVVRATEAMQPDDQVGILGLDQKQTWHADLGPVGDGSAAKEGAGELDPGSEDFGPSNITNLQPALDAAADRLRAAEGSLRHIVLLTDGFVAPHVLTELAADAAALRDEGMTTSVMGTGEGAEDELGRVAEAGGGRFYRGRDLRDLPDLLKQETQVVSRQLVVEGEYLPEVTSADEVVAGLAEAPPVGGYVATSAKPTAQVHLRVGEERDPLLASWTAGLGQVLAWASDGGTRWAVGWQAWEGSPAFWADAVRSILPSSAGSVSMVSDGEQATVQARFAEEIPAGASVSTRVVAPDGTSEEVQLTRGDATTFDGPADTGAVGTYALAVSATAAGETLATIAGTAEVGFSREYLAEGVDRELLVSLSNQTGGRAEIRAAQVWDPAGLDSGSRTVDLVPWLLALAVLCVPIFVALSRLRLTRGLAGAESTGPLKPLASMAGALAARRRVSGEDDQQRTRAPADSSHHGPSEAGSPPVGPTSPPQPRPTRTPPSATPPPAAPSRPDSSGPPDSDPPDGSAQDDSSIASLLEAKRRRRRESGD